MPWQLHSEHEGLVLQPQKIALRVEKLLQESFQYQCGAKVPDMRQRAPRRRVRKETVFEFVVDCVHFVCSVAVKRFYASTGNIAALV